jgi:hypothetical protein
MAEIKNLLLLGADALLYFVVLASLLRARTRIGLGAFFCALGVMHFLETYLASILYVSLPFGIVTSPGSTVLFTGKLMMLLLLYIREDAASSGSQFTVCCSATYCCSRLLTSCGSTLRSR